MQTGSLADRMPLGSYRFLLALIVFFSHARWNAFNFTDSNTGLMAVECFFVVSGFIIARVLDTIYAGRVWHFAVNRFLRIYPLMWAAILFSLGAVAVHGTFSVWPVTIEGWTFWDAVKSFSLVFAFPYQVWKIVPPGWTIQIEVCFYIAAAVGYAALARRDTAIRWYCFAWLTAYLLIACVATLRFENGAGFIPFFVLGIAAHRLTSGRHGVTEWALAILAFAFSENANLHYNSTHHLSIFTPLAEIERWFPTAKIPGDLTWFPILLLVFLVSLPFDLPPALRRLDKRLGNLTYPMYATHYTVNAVVGAIFPALGPVSMTLLQLPVCVGVAWSFNHLVERPLYPIRDRFRGAKKLQPKSPDQLPVYIGDVVSYDPREQCA